MKPYYQDEWWTIYNNDCRDILPELEAVDTIITDPVWPNNNGIFEGSGRPEELLREAAVYFPALSKRVVIVLGCASDPRFLMAVPRELPYLRACWLKYVLPNYVGRLLNTSDIGHVFGQWPSSRPGARVLPGEVLAVRPEKHYVGHPSPRKLEHMRWLVNWFAEGTVLDPFMGSGTTLQAAKECGYKAIGIEINKDYCDKAIERTQQNVLWK